LTEKKAYRNSAYGMHDHLKYGKAKCGKIKYGVYTTNMIEGSGIVNLRKSHTKICIAWIYKKYVKINENKKT
jgi:hypothetical protein